MRHTQTELINAILSAFRGYEITLQEVRNDIVVFTVFGATFATDGGMTSRRDNLGRTDTYDTTSRLVELLLKRVLSQAEQAK
jgi:hypothetical protein